jgi:hypothetical protein
MLFPATSFFKEFVSYIAAGRQLPAPSGQLDPKYQAMIHLSQCDAQGNFIFGALPSGNWFVVTEVKWSVGNEQQGGGLMRQITVIDGQNQQILLTDSDRVER